MATPGRRSSIPGTGNERMQNKERMQMRRQLGLVGGTVIAVAAALAGCSDDPRQSTGAAGQGGSSSGAAGSGGSAGAGGSVGGAGGTGGSAAGGAAGGAAGTTGGSAAGSGGAGG